MEISTNKKSEKAGSEPAKRNAELAVLFFAIAITVSLLIARFLPSGLKGLEGHGVWVGRFLLYFFFFYSVGRLFLNLAFYIKSRWLWTLFAVFALLFISTYATMSSISTNLQLAEFRPSTPCLDIKSSRFDVRIFRNGKAELKRDQVFTPIIDMNQIIETDFYSSGGLKIDNFSVEIYEWEDMGPSKLVPSTIEEFDPTKFVNRITDSRGLLKSKTYSRTTKLTAPKAYTDPVADAFIVVISNPVKYLECTIEFLEGRIIKPEKVRWQRLKKGGNMLPKPESLSIDVKNRDRIVVFVQPTQSGDEYALNWEYEIGPRSPR